MATTEVTTTKDQVRDLMDQGIDNAQEIADALGVTKATVYVHMRNINTERGIKPRGRGRPPKVQSDQKTTASRPAPPKAGKATTKAASKSASKAAPAKAPAQAQAPTQAQAASNGHSAFREDFPDIYKAVEAELSKARKNVARLERMLEAVSK